MLNQKEQKKSTEPVAKKRPLPEVQVRELKISYLNVDRGRYLFDNLQKRNKVPYLKLSGLWLENAGFTISSKVHIIVKNNLLVIECVDD